MLRTLFIACAVALILFALPGVVLLGADLLGLGGGLNSFLERTLSLSHRVAVSLPAAAVLFLVPVGIILLYFLRLKRTTVAVSSTFLWKKSIEDVHVNRLMQWLRRNFLLLLQVLAALLLIYGILGPRLHGNLGGGRRYILLIDNSASMSATDVAPDRLSWAKAEAIREVDASTDTDIGMVICFSDKAEIRQSYTTNRGELRAAIQAIPPTERPTRLDEALALAASLANPARSTENEIAAPLNPEPGKERTYIAPEGLEAELHLYTDGRYPAVPEFALANLKPQFHPVPVPSAPGVETSASDNVGIVNLSAERDATNPTQVLVRAGVRNYRASPVDPKPRLELLERGTRLIASYADDQTRKLGKSTPIPARSEQPDLTFTLPDVPENGDFVVRLKLEAANDAFSLDDTAWLTLGVVRPAEVLVVGPENRVIRAVLDAPSLKKLVKVSYLPASAIGSPTSKEYKAAVQDGRYDLVVYDRCAPPTPEAMPAANTLFLGTPPPTVQAGEVVNGPSVTGWVGAHPVFQNLQALDEVDLARAVKLGELPPRSQRIMEGSGNLTLVAAVPRGAYTDLVQAFGLLTDDGKWNTNWPLKVSFPLYLRNVLLTLGNVRDAASDPPTRPGQLKAIRLGSIPEVKLTTPSGESSTLTRGSRPEFTVATTDRVGIYTLDYTDALGASQVRRFAVNLFDPLESDLSVVRDELKIGNTAVATTSPRPQARDLWKLPVALGFLALLAEWWVYNKRVRL